MNYDKALEFVRRSEYTKLATHQAENPINEHDCAMLICEYGEKAERMIAKILLKNESMQAEIIAAPQMLEALEAAFDLLKEYQSMYQHPDNIDPIIDEIEAAIAAAKGEA